jgi:tRNA-specific 2-thiouridylase
MADKKDKILLAMSGGTDSSVAAIMLMEQGYDIEGVTMRMWDSSTLEEGEIPQYIQDAKQLADKLGFVHHVIDVRDKFRSSVVGNFVSEYMNARTPNPCVLCNVAIKWEYLLSLAKERACDRIATGHYAKIVELDGRYCIAKAQDEKKDQSYFLWGLSQEVLKMAYFPLANYTKEELRVYAASKGFEKIAGKKDSMEICFIEDNEYRNFLRSEIKDIDKNPGEGDFVLKTGKKIGKHKGFPFYTIGQRKGLGIALGQPAYVISIDSNTNTILIGDRDDLLTRNLWVENLNLMMYDKLEDGLELSVKIRYRSKPVLGRLFSEGEKIRLEMYEDVSAVTPGQSAVFYDGDIVVGGGLILK